MAFATSYVVPEKGTVRTRACLCYHGSKPGGDDPAQSHPMHYRFREGEKFLTVYEIWTLHRWGHRQNLPICPAHREPSDQDSP